MGWVGFVEVMGKGRVEGMGKGGEKAQGGENGAGRNKLEKVWMGTGGFV